MVVAARAGDQRARDELVAGYLPLVYNIVGRALNGHADVDDVVQESLLRMLDGLGSLRDPEAFRSWLVAVTMNEVRRYWQGHRRTPVDGGLQDAYDIADPGADFVDLTIARLGLSGQRKEVTEATRWLEPDDRALLSLWWLEAAGVLTRGEVAAALELSAEHAAVRVQRMKGQLETARVVVRALAGTERCGELYGLPHSWDGVPSALLAQAHSPARPHMRGLLRALERAHTRRGPARRPRPRPGSGGRVRSGRRVARARRPTWRPSPTPPPRPPLPPPRPRASSPHHPRRARSRKRRAPASRRDRRDQRARRRRRTAAVIAALAAGHRGRRGVPLLHRLRRRCVARRRRRPRHHHRRGGRRHQYAAGAAVSLRVQLAAEAGTSPSPRPSKHSAPPAKPSTRPAPPKPAPSTKRAAPSADPAEHARRRAAGARHWSTPSGARRVARRSPAIPKLYDAALKHSENMAAQNFFDHTDPSGAGPGERITAAGYQWSSYGENIARGQADAAAVMDSWMHSAGHRANILNCGFKEIGIGVHYGSGGPWWTQDFGTRG